MSEPVQASTATRNKVLAAARALIGKKYDELDRSNAVHKAYEAAGLTYPYILTTALQTEVSAGNYFKSVDAPLPGDLVLYPGHVSQVESL